MGRIVIACYRPKPGQSAALDELMKTHLPTLRAAGLVTDRLAITMKAEDGTVIEVFEWKSKEAIAAAHEHPEVLAMWDRYANVCDYVPVGQVAEAAKLFSDFSPLAL